MEIAVTHKYLCELRSGHHHNAMYCTCFLLVNSQRELSSSHLKILLYFNIATKVTMHVHPATSVILVGVTYSIVESKKNIFGNHVCFIAKLVLPHKILYG